MGGAGAAQWCGPGSQLSRARAHALPEDGAVERRLARAADLIEELLAQRADDLLYFAIELILLANVRRQEVGDTLEVEAVGVRLALGQPPI